MKKKVREIIRVSSMEEMLALNKENLNDEVIIQLCLNYVDDSLIELLKSVPFSFNIVYQNNNLKEKDLMLLADFKLATANKVYVEYDIADKSLYEQSLIAYYIDRYDVVFLLNSVKNKLYKEWRKELLQYVPKTSVKRLVK